MKIKPNIKFQNQCYQRGTFQNNQLLGNQSKSIIFLTTDIDCNQYSILRVLVEGLHSHLVVLEVQDHPEVLVGKVREVHVQVDHQVAVGEVQGFTSR